MKTINCYTDSSISKCLKNFFQTVKYMKINKHLVMPTKSNVTATHCAFMATVLCN